MKIPCKTCVNYEIRQRPFNSSSNDMSNNMPCFDCWLLTKWGLDKFPSYQEVNQ